jgi:TolA-binding protein
VFGRSVASVSRDPLYAEALSLLRQSDYSAALDRFERLAEAYPGSARARRGSAFCRLGLRDYAGAKEDIEGWIANLEARSERDADAYFYLGECLRGLGDADGSLVAMRKAVLVNPLRTRALKALGRV